jgi:hypothetical protein
MNIVGEDTHRDFKWCGAGIIGCPALLNATVEMTIIIEWIVA